MIGIKDSPSPNTATRCRSAPLSVIATMKPEFCITHYPGSMPVTDRKNTEFAIM